MDDPEGDGSGIGLPSPDRAYLVTSLPRTFGGLRGALSTYQTAKALISSADNRILLFFFAVHEGGSELVSALAKRRMEGLEVIACLAEDTDAPDVFLDLWDRPLEPRVLVPDRNRWTEGSLHGKAIVVDRKRALVTSANLTGWATDTNLEFGVLAGRGVASDLADLYVRLVERGLLKQREGG